MPSAFIAQISIRPERWVVKAILFPSGDQTGRLSNPGEAVNCFAWLPSECMIQIS